MAFVTCGDGLRNTQSGFSQGSVLRDFAHLEIERPAVVHDSSIVALEPVQDEVSQFWAVSVASCVRRGAHPVIEHAFGWLFVKGHVAFV